jgi:hypothetical protein
MAPRDNANTTPNRKAAKSGCPCRKECDAIAKSYPRVHPDSERIVEHIKTCKVENCERNKRK